MALNALEEGMVIRRWKVNQIIRCFGLYSKMTVLGTEKSAICP